MKELFETLKNISINYPDAKGYVLLDTCFLIHTFEHQHEHQLKDLTEKFNAAITSFNVQEFLFKEHSVDERVREGMRKFLKHNTDITIIDVGVIPGNRQSEKDFVNSIDPELLSEVPDASDAVLIAAAIKTGSVVLTKDKHHLFTVKLENYLKKYEIEVYKEYHDVLK